MSEIFNIGDYGTDLGAAESTTPKPQKTSSAPKHIFIVNPAAGKGQTALKIAEELEKYRSEYDIEVYFTKACKDATEYVCNRLQSSAEDESLRFYACGGDGSLNEVVNGVMRSGKSNCAVSVYPCGSGNDFVKALGGFGVFSDLKKLLDASEKPMDVIRAGEHYAINAVHFGFDSHVATVMGKVKTKKIIGGNNAYTTGVLVSFFTAMKNKCKITVDGETINDGDFLLCTLSNGQYVGGKYRCAPMSKYDDGLIDVCMVKSVSRLTFLKLIKYYERGEHLGNDKFKDIIVFRRAKSIELESDDDFTYSVDGEVINESSVSIEILPSSLKFVIPD